MKLLRIAVLAASLIIPTAAVSAADYPEIPRDTSFTIHSTALKIKKKYPDATVVDPSLPAGVTAREDEVYLHFDSTAYGPRDLHVDIYRPDDNKTYPALLMVHGGGWRSGDKTLQRTLARNIAKEGFVTIPVEYRLLLDATYPAGLHDVKAAVRWVRANAERLGVDPDRIAISGCSAGGHLAALVGTTNGSTVHEGALGDNLDTSSAVQAVVNIDGITTFVSDYNINDAIERVKKHNGELPVNAQWLGGMYDDAQDNWEEASALLWVTPQSAPICFINSNLSRYRDGRSEIIPLLRKEGVATEYHYVGSDIHPFWFFHPWFDKTVTYTVDFLNRTLK